MVSTLLQNKLIKNITGKSGFYLLMYRDPFRAFSRKAVYFVFDPLYCTVQYNTSDLGDQ